MSNTYLKETIERSDTPHGRRFALFIQFTIILSLIAFSVETVPDLPARIYFALELFEVVTIAIFTVEYGLRITVADHKFKFIFSFFGLVDLAVILPFYLALGFDLRPMRAVQLLRLVRILKLLRYNDAAKRYHQAVLMIKDEISLFLGVTLIMLYLSGVAVYHLEHQAQPEIFRSVFDGLWWAVATLTTVGYGDLYPVTPGGRIFTVLVLVLGLGIVAVPAGLFASALTRAREDGMQADALSLQRHNFFGRIAMELLKDDMRGAFERASIEIEKHELAGIEIQVGCVLDNSISMSSLYQDGTMQAVIERLLALAMHLDGDGKIDMFLAGTDPYVLLPTTPYNFAGYIDREITAKYHIGGQTRYSGALRLIKECYANPRNPVFIIFITDESTTDKQATETLIRALSRTPIFIQFVGLGKQHFPFLTRLDQMEGRYIDNAGFMQVNDISVISDDELYSRLLNEFPFWLQKARAMKMV